MHLLLHSTRSCSVRYCVQNISNVDLPNRVSFRFLSFGHILVFTPFWKYQFFTTVTIWQGFFHMSLQGQNEQRWIVLCVNSFQLNLDLSLFSPYLFRWALYENQTEGKQTESSTANFCHYEKSRLGDSVSVSQSRTYVHTLRTFMYLCALIHQEGRPGMTYSADVYTITEM